MTHSLVDLRTEQAIISAIPALLRFVVTNSIVAIMFSPSDTPRGAYRCSIRVDVDANADEIRTLPRTCNLTAEDNSGAILVAVCDHQNTSHAVELLHALRAALHDQDIPVLQVLTTHDLTTAGVWTDVDTSRQGPTIPYTDAAVTAHVVVAGDSINRSREDLVAEFTLTDPAAYAAIEGDFDDLVADTATELRALITGRADAPTDDLATRAAILVTQDHHLRDALLRIGLDHELHAARTWTALAAQLRGRDRAETLTMAAFNFYLAADGVRAGLALEHAHTAAETAHQPSPAWAELLTGALRALIHPDVLRAMVPNRRRCPIPGTDL